MDELISRQAAIDAVNNLTYPSSLVDVKRILVDLPTVQQEIIHCKDCKHWNLQVGNVKGDGLGSCDFHNVNLVTGEGFCYWADRRCGSDGTD